MGFHRFVMIGACCCLWAVSGCGLTPAERVELYRVQLTNAETALTEIQGRVDRLAADLGAGLALTQDANVPADERQRTWQQMQKVRAVLAEEQAVAVKVRDFIRRTQAQIEQIQAAGPVDTQGEFDAIGGAVGTLGGLLGGTVGGWASVVAAGISAAGWLLQSRKTRKTASTLGAVVKGIEKSSDVAQQDVKPNIEATMKAAGIYDTANGLVDAIKKSA